MKVAGLADAFTNLAGNISPGHRFNEIFVSLINFLTGSNAAALGIQTITLNRGQTPGTGVNFGYWNEPNRVGNRSFGVFRFLSASQGPFDIMLFCASGSNIPFDPMVIGTFTTSHIFSMYGEIGISAAAHASGSNTNPWNGTISLTSASIGSPVWKTGSLGELAVFPRPNAAGGAFSTGKNQMCELTTESNLESTVPTRWHVIATESSIAFIEQATEYSTLTTVVGQYVPRANLTPIPCSCCYMISSLDPNNTSFEPFEFWTTTYGTINGGSHENVCEGGIAHPAILSGTKSVGIMTVYGANNNNMLGGVNQFVGSGTYEIIPMWLGIAESPDYGLLGSINTMYLGYGMSMGTQDLLSGSVALGNYNTVGMKLILPWSGTAPGIGTQRVGRQWYLPDWNPMV